MNSENPPNPPEPKSAALTGSGVSIIPYGEQSFTELKGHYAKQIGEREDADVFLCANMTLLSDLRAALIECRKRGKTTAALLPISADLTTDAALPADAALITLQSMGLAAFGISADSDEVLTDGLERLAPIATIPLFIRKNRGTIESDTLRKIAGFGLTPLPSSDGTVFQPPAGTGTALLLASERQAFFLESDTTEISDTIVCSDGMETELFAASQEAYDVLKIGINTPDDAVAFAENAPMASLPVMFSGENDTAVMLALMLYQGRAMIDRTCGLSGETLDKAERKYGAVPY